ncbi:MAG: hypothetical protein JST46_05110 [Bacteroidetes bacterium]|nr:hypothetical protein [Bacteroidota bacterium]
MSFSTWKSSQLAPSTILILVIALLESCIHEPVPTCKEVLIKVDIVKQDANLGKLDGTIVASASGESKYFTYSLNNGPYQAVSKFIGLDTGKYVVGAKNSWGCIGTSEIRILALDPCAGSTMTVTSTNAALGQNNGSIKCSITGTATFGYSLNGAPPQPGNTFSNLPPGNYTITAKSQSGCSLSATATITETNPCTGVQVVVTSTIVNPSLTQNSGSITASALGGTGFTYSLNAGPYQTADVFSNLAAGTYTLTAKNKDGCTGSTQVTLTGQNPCTGVSISVTATTTNPTSGQSDGTITASASGGTGFTFSLNNGAFQSTGSFTGLAAGNYLITAKTAAGCTGTTSVALGSTNPCAGVTISLTTSTTGATTGQSNGSVTATASGGSGFTYSLNNGAFQASGTFSGLSAGTYTIVAKSSAGCLGSAQATVASVDPCAGVTVSVTGTVTNAAAGQSNGSISASATGATGFTYSINGGTYQASGLFPGLSAGIYTISAKSGNGCIGTGQFTVSTLNPCAGVTITLTAITTVSANCVTTGTGTITATATGSSGYTFNINNGAYQASGIFSNLLPGPYTIGVKDVNGCSSSTSATVGTQPAGPTFTAVKALVQSRCSGSGCHTNGQTQKGYNFDTDCSIVKAWNGIYGSTVTLTLNTMPMSPQPPLTAAEKQTITNWINAGHGFGN